MIDGNSLGWWILPCYWTRKQAFQGDNCHCFTSHRGRCFSWRLLHSPNEPSKEGTIWPVGAGHWCYWSMVENCWCCCGGGGGVWCCDVVGWQICSQSCMFFEDVRCWRYILGCPPPPAETVTTRIFTLLVGEFYKTLYFPLLLYLYLCTDYTYTYMHVSYKRWWLQTWVTRKLREDFHGGCS